MQYMKENFSDDQKKLYMALDLGTNCGYCVFDCNNIIEIGHIILKKTKEPDDIRIINFYDFLKSRFPLDGIFFEKITHFFNGPRKNSDAAPRVYGGLTAVIYIFCKTNNINYYGVDVGAIKKYITGNGRASKELIMRHVPAEIKQQNHNAIDAYCLAKYAQKIITVYQINSNM